MLRPFDDALTGRIIGCAIQIHSTLGPGFLESVYKRALLIELELAGVRVDVGRPVPVFYRGLEVGLFTPDLIVERSVILELKAVRQLEKVHEVQTVNYLKATGHDIGLLLNFGAQTIQIKRKYRLPKRHVGDD